MDFILFAIVYSLIWILSKLPAKAVYVFSDFLYFIIYYLAGYRKETVYRNISRSFPEKSEKEVTILVKKFYHFFCDVFLESFTSLHWPYEKLAKRYTVKNPELIEELYKSRKNVMLVFGHYGNWEWFGTGYIRICPYTVLIIYKPLHNKYFNRWIERVREHKNSVHVPSERSFRTILEYERNKIPYLSLMLADQRPLPNNIQHWITFLNQDTPVFLGPEKIARRTGQVAVFMNTRQLKRGHYQIEFVEITDDPGTTGRHEIIETYFNLLEKLISEQPELYLWSHKRWKFSREEIEGRKADQDSS